MPNCLGNQVLGDEHERDGDTGKKLEVKEKTPFYLPFNTQMANLIAALGVAIAVIRAQSEAGLASVGASVTGEVVPSPALTSVLASALQNKARFPALQLIVGSTSPENLHKAVEQQLKSPAIFPLLAALCGTAADPFLKNVSPDCIRTSVQAVGLCILSLCSSSPSPDQQLLARQLCMPLTDGLVRLRQLAPGEQTDDWIIGWRAHMMDKLSPLAVSCVAASEVLGEVSFIPRLDS